MVELRDGRVHVLHGHQHVLDHMMLLVKPANGLALSQLQQGDLRRNHPAKQIPEQQVIPKWNDVLNTRAGGRLSKINNRREKESILSACEI